MLQDLEKVTFEQLPHAVAMLIKEVRELKVLVEKGYKPDPDRWFDIDEVIEYMPDHPSKSAIYTWSSQHYIPCHKKGKKLQFLKSEIDAWMKTGKRKTAAEIHAEAMQYLKEKAEQKNTFRRY